MTANDGTTEDASSDRTFSIVDIAGFTALTEVHGDVEAADLAERLEALARDALGPGDLVVKTLGDAVLLASLTPEAALSLVRQLLESCAAIDQFPLVRAGLHHGPSVARGNDFFGASVNLAARVAAQAAGLQVLATQTVAEAAKAAGHEVVELGSHRFRNVSDEIHLWEIVLFERPGEWVVDPVCRMAVNPQRAVAWVHDGDETFWFCSMDCLRRYTAS